MAPSTRNIKKATPTEDNSTNKSLAALAPIRTTRQLRSRVVESKPYFKNRVKHIR
jgi:hypothetical protein